MDQPQPPQQLQQVTALPQIVPQAAAVTATVSLGLNSTAPSLLTVAPSLTPTSNVTAQSLLNPSVPTTPTSNVVENDGPASIGNAVAESKPQLTVGSARGIVPQHEVEFVCI